MGAAPGALSALQAVLAAEDAAIFGYGVAGAHLTGSRLAAAEQDWTGHNRARDALAAMISRLGAAPVAAQAFYQLPFAVHDTATATALESPASTAMDPACASWTTAAQPAARTAPPVGIATDSGWGSAGSRRVISRRVTRASQLPTTSGNRTTSAPGPSSATAGASAPSAMPAASTAAKDRSRRG